MEAAKGPGSPGGRHTPERCLNWMSRQQQGRRHSRAPHARLPSRLWRVLGAKIPLGEPRARRRSGSGYGISQPALEPACLPERGEMCASWRLGNGELAHAHSAYREHWPGAAHGNKEAPPDDRCRWCLNWLREITVNSLMTTLTQRVAAAAAMKANSIRGLLRKGWRRRSRSLARAMGVASCGILEAALATREEGDRDA